MAYDHVTKDLCQKVTQDTRAVVDRASTLLSDPADMMMVAVAAAAGPIGAAAGFVAAMVKRETGEAVEPEAAVDALWAMLRPIVLKSAGGSDAPFRDLLAQAKS